MAVSDRIAIMNHGDIQHVGTPKDIYQRPSNLFVCNLHWANKCREGGTEGS